METQLPQRIDVQGSGRSNLDGIYAQVKGDRSRVKPCYMKGGKKDPMYLYWLHGKWKIGCELDSHKSFAFSKDGPGNDHPCEPSRAWKVYNSKMKEYVTAPSAMQVCAETVQRGKVREERGEESAKGKKRKISDGKKREPEGPTPASDGNNGADVGKESPVMAAPAKPKLCLDDVPLCFRAVSPKKTPSNPNDCSSPEILQKKTTALWQRPANPNDCNSPEKTLQPPKPTLEEKKAASWFEAKIRTTLSGFQEPEQQQRKLNLIKQKITSDDFSKGIIRNELARSIIERVQLDFGKHSSKEEATSLEGKPSPQCPRFLPGQPTTPPDFFLEPKCLEDTSS